MDSVGEFAIVAFKGSEHFALGSRKLRKIKIGCRRAIRKFGGGFSGASAENQKIGERISAEAIRAMQTCRGFTCGEKARNCGCGCFFFTYSAGLWEMSRKAPPCSVPRPSRTSV